MNLGFNFLWSEDFLGKTTNSLDANNERMIVEHQDEFYKGNNERKKLLSNFLELICKNSLYLHAEITNPKQSNGLRRSLRT